VVSSVNTDDSQITATLKKREEGVWKGKPKGRVVGIEGAGDSIPCRKREVNEGEIIK